MCSFKRIFDRENCQRKSANPMYSDVSAQVVCVQFFFFFDPVELYAHAGRLSLRTVSSSDPSYLQPYIITLPRSCGNFFFKAPPSENVKMP